MAIAFNPPSPLRMLTVAGSSVATQSHNTLPSSVRTNKARWPIAKPALRPITPVSYSWKLFLWLSARASSVVQVWPRGGTYCLSSSQMRHCRGGCALSGYCVPQAVQMNRGMAVLGRYLNYFSCPSHCVGSCGLCKARHGCRLPPHAQRGPWRGKLAVGHQEKGHMVPFRASPRIDKRFG